MAGIELKLWTVEDVRRLREMAAEGKSRREMAKELHRSMDSVGGKLHKLGVVTKATPDYSRHGAGGQFKPRAEPLPQRAGRSTLPPLPSLQVRHD